MSNFTRKRYNKFVFFSIFLGTRPWNRACGEQRIDDGLIEVIGLTTYQLPLLQAGGHGTCLAQCKSAKIVTSRTIPMQVDGEAIRLNPANIGMEKRSLKNCRTTSNWTLAGLKLLYANDYFSFTL